MLRVKYEFFAQNKYLTCTQEENTQLERYDYWSFYREKTNTLIKMSMDNRDDRVLKTRQECELTGCCFD